MEHCNIIPIYALAALTNPENLGFIFVVLIGKEVLRLPQQNIK